MWWLILGTHLGSAAGLASRESGRGELTRHAGPRGEGEGTASAGVCSGITAWAVPGRDAAVSGGKQAGHRGSNDMWQEVVSALHRNLS